MSKHDSKTADEYYEGIGCKCMARYQGDCACDDVDWTPKEVYELRKKNAELVQFISENTPILSYLAIECTTNLNEFKSWLAMRDLEQQAKGIDLALSDYPCMYGDTKVYVADLENRAKDLREQAKQLKETSND